MDPLVWETKPGNTGWTENRRWVCDSPKGFRYTIVPAEAFGLPPYGYKTSYVLTKTNEAGVLLDRDGGNIFESVLLAKEAATRFERDHEAIPASPKFNTLFIERYDSGGYRLMINPQNFSEENLPRLGEVKYVNDLNGLVEWLVRLVNAPAREEVEEEGTIDLNDVVPEWHTGLSQQVANQAELIAGLQAHQKTLHEHQDYAADRRIELGQEIETLRKENAILREDLTVYHNAKLSPEIADLQDAFEKFATNTGEHITLLQNRYDYLNNKLEANLEKGEEIRKEIQKQLSDLKQLHAGLPPDARATHGL